MNSRATFEIPTHLPSLKWRGGFQGTADFWGGPVEPVADDTQIRSNQCCRIYVPDDEGVGYWEGVEFEDGFGMAINNASFHETKVLSFGELMLHHSILSN